MKIWLVPMSFMMSHFWLGDLWVSMDFLVYFLSFEVLLLYVLVKRGKRALGVNVTNMD